jgi:hypothetical protein
MSSSDETFTFSYNTIVYHQLTMDNIEQIQKDNFCTDSLNLYAPIKDVRYSQSSPLNESKDYYMVQDGAVVLEEYSAVSLSNATV